MMKIGNVSTCILTSSKARGLQQLLVLAFQIAHNSSIAPYIRTCLLLFSNFLQTAQLRGSDGQPEYIDSIDASLIFAAVI